MKGSVACSYTGFIFSLMQMDISHDSIPVISDVGAHSLKPLFVLGTILTSLTFVATLTSLLFLQAPPKFHHNASSSPSQNAAVDVPDVQTRLPTHGRTSERVLAIMALVGAIIGGVGLILLSGFDTLWYHSRHHIFLGVFMFGVALSALFTMIQVNISSFTARRKRYAPVRLTTPPEQFALLAHSHRNRDPGDYKLARTSAIFKGVAVLILLSLSLVFTIMLSRVEQGNTRSYNTPGESSSYSLCTTLSSKHF
jgi:hypothetical protein